jgi:hypothetical protein
MTEHARQVAHIEGSPCVNCGAAPCACVVKIADRRGRARSPLHRYRFPDGAILRLDASAGAEAVAAGAELLETTARTP